MPSLPLAAEDSKAIAATWPRVGTHRQPDRDEARLGRLGTVGPRSRWKGWRLTVTRAWPAPASHTGSAFTLGERGLEGLFVALGNRALYLLLPQLRVGSSQETEVQTGRLAGLSRKEQTPPVSQNWPPGLGPLWSSTVSRKQGPGCVIILVWPRRSR